MTDDPGRRTYDADEYSSLSDAVAAAVAEQKHADDVDVRVADEFDFEALDALFRPDVRPQTAAELRTNELRVTIWGDGSVEVRSLESDV